MKFVSQITYLIFFKIIDVLNRQQSDKWYDEEITGKVITMSDVFECNNKPYIKVQKDEVNKVIFSIFNKCLAGNSDF